MGNAGTANELSGLPDFSASRFQLPPLAFSRRDPGSLRQYFAARGRESLLVPLILDLDLSLQADHSSSSDRVGFPGLGNKDGRNRKYWSRNRVFSPFPSVPESGSKEQENDCSPKTVLGQRIIISPDLKTPI